MLHSGIRVTALLVIKYAQLPACPATLIYSVATVSVSRNCLGQEALSLIESLLMGWQ